MQDQASDIADSSDDRGIYDLSGYEATEDRAGFAHGMHDDVAYARAENRKNDLFALSLQRLLNGHDIRGYKQSDDKVDNDLVST